MFTSSSLSPSGGSMLLDESQINEVEQYTDDAGNVWEWDGEDWIIWDDKERKWVFDGDDWLCKADDGYFYLYDGEEWVIKGADGNYYTVTADGFPIVKQYPFMGEQWDPSYWMQQYQMPYYQQPEVTEVKKKKKKKKPQKAEQINIHAVLPRRRPCEEECVSRRTGGFSPRQREVCQTKPIELMVVKSPASCVPHQHVCPPHPPCHHAKCSPNTCHMKFQVPATMPQAVYSFAVPNVNSPLPAPQQPLFVPLCDAIRVAKQSRGTSVSVKKNAGAFVTNQCLPDGTIQKTEWIPTHLPQVPVPLITSPGVVPSSNVPSANFKLPEHHKCHHSTKSIDKVDTTTGGDQPLYHERYEDDSLKYRRFAEDMTNLTDEKSKATLDMKRMKVNQIAGFIEQISRQGKQSPADHLIQAMCKVLQNLLSETMMMGPGRGLLGQMKLWDPTDASKLDALMIRTSRAIAEAHDGMDTVFIGAESVVRQFLDVVQHPNQRNVIRDNEDRQQFEQIINGHLEDLFEYRRTFDRLTEEMSFVKDRAIQFSAKDPTCACRPRRELIEEDSKFLHERLYEANEQIRLIREKLLVAEIRAMQYKNKADYADAQVKVLATRVPTEGANLLEAGEAMENATEAMERKLHQLEKKLDAFAKDRRLEDSESLTSKLFTLTEDEKKVFEAQKPLKHLPLPPIPQTPLRTMPTPEPLPLPPIQLKVAGEEGGAIQRLALLIERLADAKEKVHGDETTENNIDRVIQQIRSIIKHVDESTNTEESMALARQLSQQISHLAFKEIPPHLAARDVEVLHNIQDMAQRMHNLAEDIQLARPRGHVPFAPDFRPTEMLV